MKKEYITTEKVIKHRRFCDDCGEELFWKMACSVSQCEICGKDLCIKCIAYEDETSGDYITCWCKSCWEIGKPYREKIAKLEEEINNLNYAWEHNALEKAKEK